MQTPRRTPWNPDRTWADPFILTLTLLVILLVSLHVRARQARPSPPPDQVELQGRLSDVFLATPSAVKALTGKAQPAREGLQGFPARTSQPWDRALLAVHAGERGELDLGARLLGAPGEVGEAFRTAWTWAYRGEGRPPTALELDRVARALGDGYAASRLRARSAARSGGDPKPLEAQAEAWVLPRLALLGAAGLGALVLAAGGLGFLIFLGVAKAPAPAPALPRFALSGRAVLIVMLGWFLTHLVSGIVVGALVALVPPLRGASLPLLYAFHALLGTGYLCLAEGLTLAELAQRVAPGPRGRALATGLGFFAAAFALVMAVAMIIGPFLHQTEPPQRELMELMARTRGPVAVGLLFLTVAGVAPVFEELMFRGFLLPWLGERLEARLGRRKGWVLAVFITGLAFAVMHLQPLGLPTLGTLGIVLGFAFLRTGNLVTSILVHGMWNGGIFLLLRSLA